MQQQHPQPVRPRYLPAAYGSAVMQRPPTVVVDDPDPPPSEELLAEADITYLGSFRMPATVFFAGSGNIETGYSRLAMAFRGKGSVSRILMTAQSTASDRVYEVTVPSLSTSEPYPVATLYKAWNYIYGAYRYGTGSLWTNGLYCNPDDWDDLRWNHFQFYDSPGSNPCWGKVTLDDATTTATAVGCWRLTSTSDLWCGSGCLKMPSDFVAANTPGKPWMVGFGGKWMSTVAGAAGGPDYYATVDPSLDLVTYPNQSALPNVTMMHHGDDSGVASGQLRARRDDDYEGAIFARCESGSSASQVVLSTGVYDDGSYNGRTCEIYQGTGIGQTGRTMTWVSGRTYTVSPVFSPAPVALDSWVEISGDEGNGVIDPVAGQGYWTIADFCGNSTAWITGTKQGICVLVTYATNRQFYGPGGPHYQSAVHRMRVYNPDDLAAVIAGDVDPWDVDASTEWDFELPGISYPMGFDDVMDRIATVTLDQANRILYVATGGWTSGRTPVVHAYQIAGSN
jgi:hypothetical protein